MTSSDKKMCSLLSFLHITFVLGKTSQFELTYFAEERKRSYLHCNWSRSDVNMSERQAETSVSSICLSHYRTSVVSIVVWWKMSWDRITWLSKCKVRKRRPKTPVYCLCGTSFNTLPCFWPWPNELVWLGLCHATSLQLQYTTFKSQASCTITLYNLCSSLHPTLIVLNWLTKNYISII